MAPTSMVIVLHRHHGESWSLFKQCKRIPLIDATTALYFNDRWRTYS
jgi:hypothetical protein